MAFDGSLGLLDFSLDIGMCIEQEQTWCFWTIICVNSSWSVEHSTAAKPNKG